MGVFPFGKLQPDVRLFFQDRWNPVGDDVRLSTANSGGGISITRGRSDEHAEVDPGSMSLVLNNGASRAFNNGGLQVTSEESASFASTPNSPDFTLSELDLRADFTNELREGGVKSLLGSEGGEFRLSTAWQSVGDQVQAWFHWTESDGTTTHVHFGGEIPDSAIGRRIAIRATLDPDIGNGQAQVKFYVGPTISGPWTLFEQDIETNTSGGIAAPTGRVQVAGTSSSSNNEFVGRVHAAMMMDSIDGSPVLFPEFNKQDAGETSFTDGLSRTWTINGANAAIIKDQPSGIYSPRNPRSPLFEDIGINTPIQVKVPKDIANSFVALQTDGDRIGAPFDASFNVTDLDVRVDMRALDLEPNINHLIACHSDNVAADRSWMLFTQEDSSPGTSEWRSRRKRFNFIWSEDGTAVQSVFSFAFDYEELWNRRFTVRVTFESDVGGNHRIVFYTGESVDGPWTHIGEWNLAGTSSLHASSEPLMIGATGAGGTIFSTVKTFRGRIYAMQMRDGVDGPIVADPDFRYILHDRSLSDDVDDSFNNGFAFVGSTVEFREPSVRFTGEVPEWPVRWDESDQDIWVPIEAAGLLRRLEASAPKPIESALFTAISNDISPQPDAYWPMEDRENSTLARPVFGQFPMNSSSAGVTRPDGRIAFANVDATVGGSGPLPNFSEGNGVLRGRLNKRILLGADSARDSWAVGFLVSTSTVETDGDTAWGDAIGIQTSPEASGLYDLIAIHFLYEDDLGAGSGGIQVTGETDPFGVHILADSNVDITDGRWAWVEVQVLTQVGNEVFYEIFLNGESIAIDTPPGGSAIETGGQPREIVVRTNFQEGQTVLGHLVFRTEGVIAGTSPFYNQISDAVGGHAGESAGRRVERLADLLGINFRGVGNLDNTLPVGPQQIDTFIENIRFAEKADPGSVVVEDPEDVGVVFVTGESQLNQDDLSLDYTQGKIVAPFVPVDDDQRIVNDLTANRTGGSSVRLVQEFGRNNVQDPGFVRTQNKTDHQARGRYASSEDFNTATDPWLEDIAGWELHRGTWDEPRYPQLNFNFARTRNVQPLWTPQVIADALAMDTGSLMRIFNTPDWLPPEDSLALGQGYSEFIDAFDWTQGWNAIPGGPNEVAVLGDYERGKRDSARTILASDVSAELFGLVLPGASGSYASTPDGATLDITSDIDLRAEIAPNSITPDNGGDGYMLVAKYDDSTDNRSYRFSLNEDGTLRLTWSTDGTAGTLDSFNTTVSIPMHERIAVRVALDVDDGNGDSNARFYIAESIDGPWTLLEKLSDTGTTSLFSGNAELAVGARDNGNQFPFAGVIFAAEVRDALDVAAGMDIPGTGNDSASTPDTAALDITGDIDIRCDATLDDWASGSVQTFVSKFDASVNQRSYQLFILATGELRLIWSEDGSTSMGASSTVATGAANGERLTVRAILDVNDGAAGHVVIFYTAPSIDGPWTQLGDTVTTAGTTSIHAGTADLLIGNNAGLVEHVIGVTHAARILDGIDGTEVANPDFINESPSTTTFDDDAGLTWTINDDAVIVAASESVVASPNFAAQDAGTTSFNDSQGLTWTVNGDAEIGSAVPKMFPVSVLLGPRWTTDPDEMPIDMMWRGERLFVEEVSEQISPSVLSATSAASNAAVASFQVPVPAGVRKGTIIIVFHSADVGDVSDMSIGVGFSDWEIRRLVSIEPRSTSWMILVGDDVHTDITLTQNGSADGIGIAVALNNAGHSVPAQLFNAAASLPTTDADGNGNYAMGIRSIGGSGTAFSAPRSGPIRAGIELRFVTNEPGVVGNTWDAPAGYTELADIASRQFVSGALAFQTVAGGETGFGVSDQFTSSNAGSDRRGLTVAVMQSNQSLTVIRSVNGIANAHSLNEQGRLFRPSVRALQIKDL